MFRMQLELEIFRQLQMKRKEAPRPSDSSDNSAGSGGGLTAGPMSSSGSGPLSSSTSGPASSSIGCPSSSPSNPCSDLMSCPKSPAPTGNEAVSSTCYVDPGKVVGSDQLDSCSTGLLHRNVRPARYLAKPARLSIVRSNHSADSDSSLSPVTLSQSVSHYPIHADNDVSVAAAAVLISPPRLTQDADNSTDIELETLADSDVMSARSNVTQL